MRPVPLQLEQGRAKVIDVNFISGTITVQTEEDHSGRCQTLPENQFAKVLVSGQK